ncbi:hypothetical protein J6590_003193 [Homalodisca vitripennis]|nr:hypothetical protein J6590_003193 [Homalodisca vitripennis]
MKSKAVCNVPAAALSPSLAQQQNSPKGALVRYLEDRVRHFIRRSSRRHGKSGLQKSHTRRQSYDSNRIAVGRTLNTIINSPQLERIMKRRGCINYDSYGDYGGRGYLGMCEGEKNSCPASLNNVSNNADSLKLSSSRGRACCDTMEAKKFIDLNQSDSTLTHSTTKT